MMLLRAGATVSARTLAGRVPGFARPVLIAAWLGAGPAADAFLVALRRFGLLRAGLAAFALFAWLSGAARPRELAAAWTPKER